MTFNTVMSLAYGPPALLGLVVRRTPSWSGLASFAVALAVGVFGTFVLGWGLVTNVLTVVPSSVAVFFLSRLFPEKDPARAARHDDLFRRLDTPVDMAAELGGHPRTRPREVFRFLSRTTGLVGLLCLPFVLTAPPGERATAVGYVAITLALAAALAFVKGKDAGAVRDGRRPGGHAMRRTIAVLRPRRASSPPRRPRPEWPPVWAVSDGEKVERDDRAHPLKARNAVWDGRTVRLAAARNEIVAFQVIVEADAAGIGALSASLPELRRRGGSGDDRLRAAGDRPDASPPAGRSSSSPSTT